MIVSLQLYMIKNNIMILQYYELFLLAGKQPTDQGRPSSEQFQISREGERERERCGEGDRLKVTSQRILQASGAFRGSC